MRLVKVALLLSLGFLGGCASLIPQSGPTAGAVKRSEDILVLELTPSLAKRLEGARREERKEKLSEFMTSPYSPAIGAGDILEITLYEAPPPVLLGFSEEGGTVSVTLPPQRVDDEGFISVPFVGRVKVAGKRPEDVAKEIEEALKGIANQPQAVVRILQFNSSQVTVLGHVARSGPIALDYNTLTLLDVIARAGGATSPINKTLVKLTRNGKTIILPLRDVLSNPEMNVYLKPGDVVTLVYKTQSATFLGAFTNNTELEFEAQGITLSQAFGRVGGLNDNLANVKGVFLFRFENPEILKKAGINVNKTEKIPVVYTIDMSNPSSFFVLREVKLRDGDILYVADAPAVQLGKFLGMLRDVIQPVFMIDVMTRR